MKTLNDIIGEQIRKRRKALGLSQEKLSKEIGGCGAATVHHWEHGRFSPNTFYLCALADVLGCSVDSLLGRSGERMNLVEYKEKVFSERPDVKEAYEGLERFVLEILTREEAEAEPRAEK